jgi:hypothetical protein
MPNYISWNTAVARFFTANVPRGASVFLTLNDDALQEIAATFLDSVIAPQDVADDFANAVRERVVTRHLVTTASIAGSTVNGVPKGVAFLGLMVLAAHRMVGDDEISPINYFSRLTEQLGVRPSNSGNRPAGLGTGDEEVLWIEWNRWLQMHGWEPTAALGPEGPRKYLNYVLTQALIRDDDKIYLQKQFRENQGAHGITHSMDEVRLAGWLQRANSITRRYLRDGFRNSDPRRAAAFYEAAYRVYEDTNWKGGGLGATFQRSRVINAGLMRSVSLAGQVNYRLYLSQPTNWIPRPLEIDSPSGIPLRLIPDRSGYFKSLWDQEPFVREPVRMKLLGDALLEAVVFPAREFWILTADPEDPTGAFATWEKFPSLLGQKFILICSREGGQKVQQEMKKFRDGGLLNWDSGPHTIRDRIDEYRGCMILSSGWDGVVPSEECVGLYEALKPKQFATLSLSDGIRAPGQNAWLVGTPPLVTIYGFEEEFQLRLLAGESEVFARSQERQQPARLESGLPAGIYSLEVKWNDQLLYSRSFRLIDWEEMEVSRSSEDSGVRVVLGERQLFISGAVLEDRPNGPGENHA